MLLCMCVSLCVGRGGGGCCYTTAALLHGNILVLRYSLKGAVCDSNIKGHHTTKIQNT